MELKAGLHYVLQNEVLPQTGTLVPVVAVCSKCLSPDRISPRPWGVVPPRSR